MNTTITIRYTTDDATIADNINAILTNVLPYMVDNVTIRFESEE